MGSLRNPVGSLAPAVYWRRRVLVVLALLAVLALILYACSGSGSGKKKQPAGDGRSSSPAASQTSAPSEGGSSSPAASGGASGSASSASAGGPSGGASGGATSAGGANGGTGGVNGGGTGGVNGGGTGGVNGGGTTGGIGQTGGTATGPGGCQLSLSLSTPSPAYANGDNPQFTVAVVNKGTSDCDVDVSPKALILNVYSGQDHIWSSADCATGGKDLRGIAPGGVQTVTYTWNRTRSSPGCAGNGASVPLGTYFGVASLAPGSGPNAPAAQSQPKTFELKTGS